MPLQPQPPPASRLLSAPPHWTAAALAGVRHGFFGREGGVSTGIYASLNAGTGSDDDPAAIAENRRRIAAAFGAQPSHLIGVHQMHSPDAVFVDTPWTGERPHADALVTTTRGLVLSVLTADCTPVLLVDVEAGVIGAAHAGWKGALAGVLGASVALMRKHGAARIAAAIGPCIGQASYEVGSEFRERFVDADAAHARCFAEGNGGKFLFDLPGLCASQLTQAGVERIDIVATDTYRARETLFSRRRGLQEGENVYGRNCSALCL